MTAMMRLLVLFVAMIMAHGEEESTAPSVSQALSISVAPTSSVVPSEPPTTTSSGAPTGPPTAEPTISPTNLGGFQDLDPVCGDCWCVADPECPPEQVGITQTFPDFISDLYATFVATNSIPLEAEGGSGCYPFADALESKLKDTSYPESKLPQCKYSENEDGICAFVFEDANDGFSEPTECEGRRYSMQTFDTKDDVPPRASITHKGPCGVCSSAQDLSRSMKLRNRLATIGTLCGTSYYLNGLSFENLVQCYEIEGFTRECSELLGHRVATSAELCALECLSNKGPLNGDPPECAFTDCLSCGNQFHAAYDRAAGRNQPKSGITEQIGRNCSEFYPVVHDPCPGQKAPPVLPTPSPITSGGVDQWGTAAALMVVSVMMGWQM